MMSTLFFLLTRHIPRYPSRHPRTSSASSGERHSVMMSRTLLAVILKMRLLLASSGSSDSSQAVAMSSPPKMSAIADVLLGFFPKVSFMKASSGSSSGSSFPNSAALGSSSSVIVSEPFHDILQYIHSRFYLGLVGGVGEPEVLLPVGSERRAGSAYEPGLGEPVGEIGG